MKRRDLLTGLLSIAALGVPNDANARGRRGRRRRRGRGFVYPAGWGKATRGEAKDGQCPCNGGDVCVGARGGRYCMTSSGRKRYGV